jgi:hypothetical protein
MDLCVYRELGDMATDPDDIQKPPPPLPEKRGITLPSGWTYENCVGESDGQRLLQGFEFSKSNLTPLTCIAECSKRGFIYAGTEYGTEVGSA